MKKYIKKILCHILFINMILLFGCGIQYRNDDGISGTKFSSITHHQNKPSIVIICRLLNSNRFDITNKYEINKLMETTKDAYVKSGLFSSVRIFHAGYLPGSVKADFISEVNMFQAYDVRMSSCCTLGSLYVIPSKGNKIIQNITTIKDMRDKFIKTYKNSGSYTSWLGIIFIPINPFFKSHHDLDIEIYHDTNLDVLRQLFEDRFTAINI